MSHPRFHAEHTPEKPAVIVSDTGQTLSYAELEHSANKGAHALRNMGIKAGDTIAIWLPNKPEYFEVYWAGQRAGVYITPISTALTGEEAAYILNDCGAKLLVTHPDIKGFDVFMRGPRPSSLQRLIISDGPAGDLELWPDLIAPFPKTPIEDETAGFHLVYSSGTTGRPKGIRLPLTGGPATEPHMLAERIAVYGIDFEAVYLSPAPLYHTAPLAYTTSCHRLGATVIVMPQFDAEATLQAIDHYRVTHAQMVPTMFVRMIRLADEIRARYEIGSVQAIIHAAAPCPIDIKRQMMDWFGPILYEYYGGSEGNGATGITPQEWLKKPGSVGKANWGTIHICNDAGEECPVGEQGLVYFEGGWDFKYMNDPDKTKDARHARNANWTTLGDIGYLDEDGYLFLTDRQSFMIISGGVNIYPQEIENLLISHPKVMDAAVIGVPHSEMGEEVKAVVQPVDPQDATDAFAALLMVHCRDNLSHVKCPRSIDFDMALPRLDNGKLYKRQIRDRYWDGHGKRVN